MAPQRTPHQQPDPYEQEYAIRQLTAAVTVLQKQLKENSENIMRNREDIIVIKTRWALMCAIAGGVGAAVFKMLPPIHL